jgi:hypothetical protein
MANPPSIIWRSLSGSGAENNAESKIEIELTPATGKDSTGHIHQTEWDVRSGIGENEKPLGSGNELQDTKFEGLTAIITGTMQITIPPGIPGTLNVTTNPKIAKIWLLEDKTTATFTKGRFGIRTDDFDIFNLTPTSTRGIMIQDIKFIRPAEQRNRVDFVMTLRYNFGDIGTTPYNW